MVRHMRVHKPPIKGTKNASTWTGIFFIYRRHRTGRLIPLVIHFTSSPEVPPIALRLEGHTTTKGETPRDAFLKLALPSS